MSRVPTTLAIAATLTLCGVLIGGCGTPPELRPPGAVVPSPQTTQPSAPATGSSPTTQAPVEPGPAATPTFAEGSAVSCAGYPSRAQVLTLLTGSAGLIPQGTGTVKVGPLCAGTWQYTTVEVPNRDMLEVITKGAPNALVLVTAGTNVCNIPVRTSAPIGIRTVACESGPAPGNV